MNQQEKRISACIKLLSECLKLNNISATEGVASMSIMIVLAIKSCGDKELFERFLKEMRQVWEADISLEKES